MKILLQRVSGASVSIDGEIVGSIGRGLLLLVGFGRDDRGEVLLSMANKVVNMRVFPDDSGRFSHSLMDIGGEALLVPQFTLYADTRKGRRPDFTAAMPPGDATHLFDEFTETVKAALPGNVQTGRFGVDMQVSLINDGPVTILLQS
jgi:D-tyrosyl-tRNA(Tyr) deacylase